MTYCWSSVRSSGVKQSMSLPTARRIAWPDVGDPLGTTARTTIRLLPVSCMSSMSAAIWPAPHRRIALSNAPLGRLSRRRDELTRLSPKPTLDGDSLATALCCCVRCGSAVLD